MTRLPEFLETLAALDGRRIETLEETARVLRSTGYLPASKRGLGATQIDSTAAANLLLACLAMDRPADAPRALEVYRNLRSKNGSGFGRGFPSLQLVSRCATFAEALSTLIAVGQNLKAEALGAISLLYERLPPERMLALDVFTVEVTVSRPVPHARIVLRAVDHRGLDLIEFMAEWVVDANLFMGGFYAPEMQAAQADRRTETTITHKTIFRLADLITDPAADDEALEENEYA